MNIKQLIEEDKNAVIERFASIEHERWSKWQRYLHSRLQYEEKNFGSHTVAYYLLDAGLYEHWQRQTDTDYSELSEKEKESDREQVMPYIDWHTQSLISLIRSEIERKKILKKKTIINMLQDDDVFDNNGLDGVYGYNTAIAEDIDYWEQVLLDLEK